MDKKKNNLVRHNGCSSICFGFFRSSKLLWYANHSRNIGSGGNRCITAELFCRIQRMVYSLCHHISDIRILSGIFQEKELLLF